ncbi:MAG: hypothetical protein JW874_08575 [Spirochaetales bacterium]|nr:hypothetical protein [Spirochaetales bacterium]
MITETGSRWWEREDLCYKAGELTFSGQKVSGFAGQAGIAPGIPLFLYNTSRIETNLARLKTALDKNGFRNKHRIYYAMKANRFAPLLRHLKSSGLCGIDTCSPSEVLHALSCGFGQSDISYTGTSLSAADIDILRSFPELHLNIDSIFTLKSWASAGGNKNIGIRINPAAGIGRGGNDMLHYSGDQTTKFGIYIEQFGDAVSEAEKLGLKIRKIHFHTGCGYLTPQLPVLDRILDKCFAFIRRLPDLEAVNLGGGLGVPHTAEDEALDLDAWAALLHKYYAGTKLRLEVEPGDYLVKDAGILMLTVNYQEYKKDTLFTFLNCGFNIAPEPAVYSLPFEPVPLVPRKGPEQATCLAGNINEALDIWYRKIALPPLHPGDKIVLINAGAYSASMASNHCMRGDFREMLVD